MHQLPIANTNLCMGKLASTNTRVRINSLLHTNFIVNISVVFVECSVNFGYKFDDEATLPTYPIQNIIILSKSIEI